MNLSSKGKKTIIVTHYKNIYRRTIDIYNNIDTNQDEMFLYRNKISLEFKFRYFADGKFD